MSNFKEDYERQTAFVDELFERLKNDESWEQNPDERKRLSELLRFNIEHCIQ